MAKFTFQVGVTVYRLVHQDGSEGEVADFGLPSFLTDKSNSRFMGLYIPGEGEDDPPECQEVFSITPISPTLVECEDVEFPPEIEDGESDDSDTEEAAGDGDSDSDDDGDDGSDDEPVFTT